MLLQTRHIQIDNNRLRYFMSADTSKAKLVLLHGYPDNLQIWHRVVPLLEKQFCVLAFDWPGMGDSEAWSGGATPLVMAQRLKKILAHFQWQQIHLAAHDMGAQAALVFAAEYAENTLSVCAMNSLLFWNQKTSWEITLLRKFRFNEFALQYLPRVVFQRAIHTFVNQNKSISVELKNELWQQFKRKEVRHYIVRMCAGYNAQLKKLPEYYKNIQCPVTLIWAEKGKHFSIEHAYAFKDLLPHTRIIAIPSAQHWMVLEAAEEISRLMLAEG